MNQNHGLCLLARVILPIEAPPIENGYVLIYKGRIVEIGKRPDFNTSHKNFHVVDCGDSVLFPAFINAHAHLEYTCLHGKIHRQKSFTEWIKRIVEVKKRLSVEDYKESWKKGAEMLVKTGCGVVANIESTTGLIPGIWKETPLIVFSLIEILGLQDEKNKGLDCFITERMIAEKQTKRQIGLSPHSLYSLSPEMLCRCIELSKKQRVITSIHIAESREEYEMFKYKKGELLGWLQTLGRGVGDCGLGSPIQTLWNYLPSEKLILVHANYIEDEDLQLIKSNKSSVVHCPRSFAYFGHEHFHLKKLFANRINVCIGTDSLASIEKRTSGYKCDVGLNMFSEMRQFASVFSDIEPQMILRMTTLNGARALGIERYFGDLNPGMFANIAGIPFSEKENKAYEYVVHYKRENVGFLLLKGQPVFAEKNYKELFNLK